jgi:hypothetical protein
MNDNVKSLVTILGTIILGAIALIFAITLSTNYSYKHDLKQCSYEYGTPCIMMAVPKGFAKEFK